MICTQILTITTSCTCEVNVSNSPKLGSYKTHHKFGYHFSEAIHAVNDPMLIINTSTRWEIQMLSIYKNIWPLVKYATIYSFLFVCFRHKTKPPPPYRTYTCKTSNFLLILKFQEKKRIRIQTTISKKNVTACSIKYNEKTYLSLSISKWPKIRLDEVGRWYL